jgi:dTDP-4-amino-4,6-dideoxygalactose transaminase
MNTLYHVPYYGKSFNQFIERALHSRSLSRDSNLNIECQKKIKSMLSTNSDILMTPSCTLGREIVSSALNLGPKDEVIVPAYGFVTSVTSLTRFGAKPVFVDVCQDNRCINNSQVKNAID